MEEENKGKSIVDQDIKGKENQKSWFNKGIMNYSGEEKQTVFSFLGIELTAPTGLKNPGLIYISFVLGNIILFIFLRKFVGGQ